MFKLIVGIIIMLGIAGIWFYNARLEKKDRDALKSLSKETVDKLKKL